MKFIKIFKRTTGEEFGDISLELIAWQKDLTEQQFDDLFDYFVEIVSLDEWSNIGGTDSFEITNNNEELEDCPLPDGTIIMDKEFVKGMQYIVVLGNTEVAPRVKIGVTL